MVGDDTCAYRRDLPHLAKEGKTYFVTFVTQFRFVIPEFARDVVLEACVRHHQQTYWLHTATVMPDHVHMVLTPLEIKLSTILGKIKGASSYAVNRLLKRSGPLWRRESFDHILRSDEDLQRKCAYVLDNPVRAGLVRQWQDYRWSFGSYAG